MSIYQYVEFLRDLCPPLAVPVVGRVTGMDLLLGAAVAMAGACLGSFLNVVIWRVPRGESVVLGISHCPRCNRPIRPWDNIPILSWLLLRGRCRDCRAPIAPRYLAVEALTACLVLALWLRAWQLYTLSPYGKAWPTPLLAAQMILILALVAIAFIDLDLRTVPDRITLFGIGVALVFAVGWPASHELVAPPRELDALNHKLLLKVFAGYTAAVYPGILDSPRLLALLDSGLGIVFGGGILWLLSEVGKLVRGRKTIRLKEPGTVELRGDGYQTPTDGFENWDDTFIRAQDTLIVRGQVTEVTVREDSETRLAPDTDLAAISELRVTEQGLQLPGQVIPLADLESVKITSREWVIPLEPMGLGDATLMAMVGAFLGPGAVIFVLCLGSLIGAAVGVVQILASRARLHTAMPFGPSLAVGALAYIFLYWEILGLWFAVLRPLYLAPGTY